MNLAVKLGDKDLRTPLIAASGTVGSVVEFAEVASLRPYGAAVAKSVSPVAWDGRTPPRMAPVGASMLNGIGIQNPGVEAWLQEFAPSLADLDVDVWASAVGHTVAEFAQVAAAIDGVAAVGAVEVNLACPNLDHEMFALSPDASAKVISEVRAATNKPIGAKLSPNSEDIVRVAAAVQDAGADWVVLTNTAWGFGVDIDTRKPLLSGSVGGYSGVGLKPIALRCVWEVHQSLPGFPIVGCGGVRSGRDVVEYLMAGASAVQIGSTHFAEPRAGKRIIKELNRWLRHNNESSPADLVGTATPW